MAFKDLTTVFYGLSQYILLYLNDYFKILFPPSKKQIELSEKLASQ